MTDAEWAAHAALIRYGAGRRGRGLIGPSHRSRPCQSYTLSPGARLSDFTYIQMISIRHSINTYFYLGLGQPAADAGEPSASSIWQAGGPRLQVQQLINKLWASSATYGLAEAVRLAKMALNGQTVHTESVTGDGQLSQAAGQWPRRIQPACRHE